MFLGGTLLFSMWKVSRDPEQRRRKTMNKNKASACCGVLWRVHGVLPPAACWLGRNRRLTGCCSCRSCLHCALMHCFALQ